jgi:hypothetical protein
MSRGGGGGREREWVRRGDNLFQHERSPNKHDVLVAQSSQEMDHALVVLRTHRAEGDAIQKHVLGGEREIRECGDQSPISGEGE